MNRSERSHGTRPPWRATYRLQLTADFGFAAAEAAVSYLSTLGISHLYLSPVLESVSGSTHGYDGIDPTRVSAERGGEAALQSLADAAHDAGLGVVIDLVPNHLAASAQTPWWADPAERPVIFDVDPATGWYRRFFDIDGLAGVRQEDPEVFARTHTKIFELVHDGVVDGLRVDHPDGLVDPAGYLQRLHDRTGVPIWVEKILHPGEALRPWPVAGTVGYEFANEATGLFVDPSGEVAITEAYGELTGRTEDFATVAQRAKEEQLHGPFARELERLCELAPDIDRDTIAATVAAFPIYRTYVDPASGLVTDADRQAVASAGAPPELAQRLLLDERGHDEFITRFQQTTAPVTAKGVEDTAFYRWTRLLALNEVGGDPTHFGCSVAAFHEANVERARRFPIGLLAATTHDTKRSGDSRARIAALSTLADEFVTHVRHWFIISDQLVTDAGPTDAERWLIFQTLLGSWPITNDRLDDFLVKAMREAKEHTNWADPDVGHEQAVLDFSHELLILPAFVADFRPFAEQINRLGEAASLGQVLLRATSPGICDVYQGDETWFLSVVDPDNRRPFDWDRRRTRLSQVGSGAPVTAASAKFHVLHHALALRARRPDPFAGPYRPLDAGVDTVAFLRGEPGDDVLVMVPVRQDANAHVSVPTGTWRDVISGAEGTFDGTTPVDELVGDLGVACWESRG